MKCERCKDLTAERNMWKARAKSLGKWIVRIKKACEYSNVDDKDQVNAHIDR